MWKKISQICSKYWKLALGAAGAALLAIPGIFELSPEEKLVLWLLGAFFVIYGAVLEKINSRTIDELEKENTKLKRNISELKEKRIFIVLSSYKEEWQTSLNFHLLQIAQSHGFYCEVFFPKECFNNAEQAQLLNSIAKSHHKFSGGLVVVSNCIDESYEDYRNFAKDIKVPVVFMDHDPPKLDGKSPEEVLAENIGWVTVLNEAGGRQAATLALLLGNHKSVLAIGGPWKQGRQIAFREELKRRKSTCSVKMRECEGFSRELAAETAFLELSKANRNNLGYDLVFCVTDELTLGCLDAIAKINWPPNSPPIVIGYDGTKATRSLVIEDKTPLRGIVIQDAEKIATAAVLTLIDMLGPRRKNRITYVPPASFPKRLS